MSGEISREAGLFLQAFRLGIYLMVLYDFLRVFRLLLHHNTIALSVEDLLYWIFNGFAVFRLLFMENDGKIRGFAMGSLFLGMLVYSWLVSPIVIKVVQTAVKRLKKIIRSLIISIKKR